MTEIFINVEGVRVLDTKQNILTRKLKVKESNIRWQEIREILCDDMQLVINYVLDGANRSVTISNELFCAKEALMSLIRYRFKGETRANKFRIAIMDEENKYSINIFKEKEDIGHDLQNKELTEELIVKLEEELAKMYD